MVDDKRLTRKARQIISNQDNRILISVVSAWEMELKKQSLPDFTMTVSVQQAIKKSGFVILDLQLDHVAALAHVPPIHKDPFDRMLIAQAKTENAVFVSDDRVIAEYPGLKVLF